MLPPEIRPYKADPAGTRLGMLEAYRRDIDFWGNDERKLFHVVTKSLVDFLVSSGLFFEPVRESATTVDCSGMFRFWCDIGCGPGYFLEGVKQVLRDRGFDIISSGVDISSEALARCREVFNAGENEFVEVNLDNYKRLEGNYVMPWINADVVSFIDTLQYFKDYRRTFNEICDGLRVGTHVVVADGMGRSNMRDYPKSLDTMALVGQWIDRSMPVTPRDPNVPHSKNRYYVYRVYRKML